MLQAQSGAISTAAGIDSRRKGYMQGCDKFLCDTEADMHTSPHASAYVC